LGSCAIEAPHSGEDSHLVEGNAAIAGQIGAILGRAATAIMQPQPDARMITLEFLDCLGKGVPQTSTSETTQIA